MAHVLSCLLEARLPRRQEPRRSHEMTHVQVGYMWAVLSVTDDSPREQDLIGERANQL